ncbi:hypothetical protein FRC18_005917 [Serendipita sp. 400]|nr:hypothetical protein FRC18_005917 [Serendipita sp. 400]
MKSNKYRPQKYRSQKFSRELKDYTSLIRTLHTTSTQNIVPHLTGSFVREGQRMSPPSRQGTSPPTSELSREPDNDGEVEQGPSTLRRRGDALYATRKGKATGDIHGTAVRDSKFHEESEVTPQKDIWTKWPLLRGTIPIPEWSLQDEVRRIAEISYIKWCQKHHPPRDSALRDDSSHTEQENTSRARIDAADGPILDEGMSQSLINGLSLDASAFLSHVFFLLAAHRPDVSPSLQGRLAAMDWKAVLRIVGASGYLNEDILREANKKMNEIYSATEVTALHRREQRIRAKRKLEDMEEKMGLRGSVLAFTDAGSRRKRRKLKK